MIIVLFLVLIIFFIILFIFIVEALGDPAAQKEARYQEYKTIMDKRENSEKELLEFAERYKREKESGE